MGCIDLSETRAWENLAEAIIVRACKDYRKAYRRHLKRHNKETEAEVNHLRKFFRSDWFEVLTTANGEAILQDLEKEVRRSFIDPKIRRKRASEL